MKSSVSEEMIVRISEPDPMYDVTFTVYPAVLTRQQLEEAIVFERLRLYNSLKPCGAVALRRQLQYLGLQRLPSVRTIGRILDTNCLTNGRTGYYPEDYQ